MILEHPDVILEEIPILLELGTFIRAFFRILELLIKILANRKQKTEQPPSIRKPLSSSFRIILHNAIVNGLSKNFDILVRYQFFSIFIVSYETEFH